MLANRLKAILADRNITIQNLVDNTSLSRNTISNLINKPEGNINISTVDEICSFLGIEISNFFSFYPYTLVTVDSLKDPDQSPDPDCGDLYIELKHLGDELTFYFGVTIVTPGSSKKCLVTIFTNSREMEKIYSQMPPYFQQQILYSLLSASTNKIDTYFINDPKQRFFQAMLNPRKVNQAPDIIPLKVRYEFCNTSVVRSLRYDLANVNNIIDKG